MKNKNVLTQCDLDSITSEIYKLKAEADDISKKKKFTKSDIQSFLDIAKKLKYYQKQLELALRYSNNAS